VIKLDFGRSEVAESAAKEATTDDLSYFFPAHCHLFPFLNTSDLTPTLN
jgi:hypothetical protein